MDEQEQTTAGRVARVLRLMEFARSHELPQPETVSVSPVGADLYFGSLDDLTQWALWQEETIASYVPDHDTGRLTHIATGQAEGLTLHMVASSARETSAA